MSLSKTAKRFLSSTMAIALAGGSVLAFGNSALAGAKSDPGSVSFISAVSPECAIEVASDVTEYDVAATAEIAGEERTTALTATDSIGFDCNTSEVQVKISDTSIKYTAPTGGASDLTATSSFQYGLGADPSVDVEDGPLASKTTTDANGDLVINVSSTWTADGEELSAQTYGAKTIFTVTAK